MKCSMDDCVFDTSNINSFLYLMQLFSANSPLGNFNYSHGLEFAVKQGWIVSVSDFVVWQQEFMDGQLLYLDLPMLKRFYDCLQHSDQERFLYYVNELLSFRATYELRLEEQDRGEIIVNWILQLGLSLNSFWNMVLKRSILASIAWIGYFWKIPLKMLCISYAYSNLESNIIAGLKLIPFGQFTSQRLLMNFSKLLPLIWKRSYLITDKELGSGFPIQEIASSCHEVQDSRLFRS